jgi:hypothetical protein
MFTICSQFVHFNFIHYCYNIIIELNNRNEVITLLNTLYEQFMSTIGIHQLSETKLYSDELDVTMEVICENLPVINTKRIISITFTNGYST